MFFTTPDLPTLRLCSLLASVAFSLVFLTLWRGRAGERHLLHWGLSSVLYVALLLVFEAAGGPQPTLAGAVLFALLPASNALVLSGANLFDGRRAFEPWMAAPIALTGLLYAAPLALFDDPAEAQAMALRGGTIGLAISVLATGAALAFGRQNHPTVGRRIAGWAIAAYAPGYLLTVAADALMGSWAERFGIVPHVADQLLLPVLYLGLLAMPGERARQTLRDHALNDPLTGAGNRRALDEALEGEAFVGGLGVVLIDIDHFKTINDRDGHAVGDAVLIALTEKIAALAPVTGCRTFRLGGDEFLALLPRATERRVARFAEDVRVSVAAGAAGAPAFSVSVGTAVAERGEAGLTPALARADAALYRAKAAGRNRSAA